MPTGGGVFADRLCGGVAAGEVAADADVVTQRAWLLVVRRAMTWEVIG